MENPIKNGMIWGVHPYFWKHPYDGMFLFLFLIDVFFQEDMKKHNPVQVSHWVIDPAYLRKNKGFDIRSGITHCNDPYKPISIINP